MLEGRKTLKKLFWLLGLALGISLILGCSKPSEPPSPGGVKPITTGQPRKKVRIAIITNGLSPFWDPMAVGMKRAAEKYGCEASWAGPQTSQIPEQRRLVEEALSRGVDGIAISAIEAGAMTPVINNAVESGVLVITIDSDAPKSKRLVYIGTNNYNAGLEAGKVALKLLPQGGNVVGFVGNRSAQNARERIQGFVEATKGHRIQLLDVREDNIDPVKAQKNVEDVLQAMGGKVDLLLGIYSYNGPAIARAVKAAGLQGRVKILCFDAEPATLDALEKGEIDATIVQKPYEFGYRAVELLYRMKTLGIERALRESKVPPSRIVDTGVEVVTPQNIKAFRKRLAELGVKSS